MNSKIAAAFILSIFVIGLGAPLCLENTDALDSDDYYITIPGTKTPAEEVYETIGNGKEHTWSLYVVNTSELYLDVYFDSSVDSNEVHASALKPSMLRPSSTGDNVYEGTFTISVDEVSGAHDDVIVDLVVTVMDASDPESLIVNHVIFNIKVESIYDTSGSYNKFFGIIPNTLVEPFNSAIVAAIVTILVNIALTGLLCRLLIPVLARILDKQTTEEDADKFERALFWMLVPLSLVLSINQGLSIMGVDTDLIATASTITAILVVILVMFILWTNYVFIITSILSRIERANADSAIDTSLVPLFKMIGRIIFWVAGVSAVLGTFGVDLQGILVSAGVISLGITLGAQNVLSQFFSGLVILTTRPFRAGDFLKINGEVYVVRKVKLMYTEFNNWAGDEIVTMPNNVVTSSTIRNTTKGDTACKQYVFFSVAYGTDLQKAGEVMIEAAKKSKNVLLDGKHEEPSVRVTNFLSSGIEMRLSVYAPTFDDTGALAGEMRQLVYEAFRENGIEIPYDRVQIDILSDNTRGSPDKE